MTLWDTPIDIVNVNQVETKKWIVDIFKSSAAQVLFVFSNQGLVKQSLSIVLTLKDTSFNVVNPNMVESNRWLMFSILVWYMFHVSFLTKKNNCKGPTVQGIYIIIDVLKVDKVKSKRLVVRSY